MSGAFQIFSPFPALDEPIPQVIPLDVVGLIGGGFIPRHVGVVDLFCLLGLLPVSHFTFLRCSISGIGLLGIDCTYLLNHY
jgi:hypothetical protein